MTNRPMEMEAFGKKQLQLEMPSLEQTQKTKILK